MATHQDGPQEAACPSVVGCRDAAEGSWQPVADLSYLTEWTRLGAGEGRCDFPELTRSLAREAFKTTAPRRASGTITGLNRETLVAIIVGKEELV